MVKRYLIRVIKYIGVDGELHEIGREEVETDSNTLVSFISKKALGEEAELKITLEFVEERKYEERNGMLEKLS
jgi:hypothetical protein